jgi:hypothetical protein
MTFLRFLRPLTVIVLSGLVVATSVVIVRADSEAMAQFCSDWGNALEDPDYVQCLSDYWSWNGSYDVSSLGDDALMTAAEICDDLTFSCWETCESAEYAEYLSWSLSAYPCESWPTECFITWGTASCEASTSGTFSCQCQYFNQCECSPG